MNSLRPYQKEHAVRLLAILREKRAALDASFTGSGKTYCAAQIAKDLNTETLVVCPLSVVATWRRIMESFGVNATVINFESCWRKFGKVIPWGGGSYFKFDRVWPLTIYDECHRVAGDTTINSKMAIATKRAGGMMLMLSASAASTLLKFRALGFALDLHKLSDYQLWLFARGARYEEIKLRSGRIVKKVVISKQRDLEAMGRLHEEIFGHGQRGSRMRLEDIPEFPKTLVGVRLLSDAPAAVARLSEELQLFYKHRTTLGAMSKDELAKLVFFRQASETAKIPHIVDMMQDALETSKVAVFCCFNQTVDELLSACRHHGWSCGVIRGEQSSAERQRVIDAFQANQLDVVVANIQAGGVGVSLHDPVTQVPRTSIISPSWSAMELKQALGRVHRGSGGYSRQYIVLFDRGIETRVAKSVQRKLDNLSLLNDSELSDELGSDEPAENSGTLA